MSAHILPGTDRLVRLNILECYKALTHYKDFHNDFSLRKSLPLYKTVEKIVAVVKKSGNVYEQ